MSSLRQQHAILVNSARPPIIEIDPQCQAIYVRFSGKTVAKTLERSSDGMIVTLDLDRDGEVVGIEGIGFKECSLSGLLKAANVRTERMDFSKARWRSTSRHVGRETVPV